jgi:hypothetical protein
MLYSWRDKRKQTDQPFEEQKLHQAEMAKLKRINARLEEEAAFLKKWLDIQWVKATLISLKTKFYVLSIGNNGSYGHKANR